MNESIVNIEFSEDEQSISQLLESELLDSLGNTLPQAENVSFVLSARDPNENIIGGLSASTSYGWLLVKLIWVDKDYRNQGLGRLLMERAERKGVKIGCHGAWLDTSNPEAMAFYLRLGYEQFGLLSNTADQQPESHKRWFMKKSLPLEAPPLYRIG
jgi:GNAT superfamily N-acetyltransferase